MHVLHLVLYRRIYADEEDTRALAKYSRPMRYLRTLTCDGWRISYARDDDRLKHTALTEVGEAAAMRATARVRRRQDVARSGKDSRADKSSAVSTASLSIYCLSVC